MKDPLFFKERSILSFLIFLKPIQTAPMLKLYITGKSKQILFNLYKYKKRLYIPASSAYFFRGK